jgi:glycosyltransferase involved in cell wall biosynthesis
MVRSQSGQFASLDGRDSSKRALVIGHYPPPITGERLCCVHLCGTLRELGWQVSERKKYEWRNVYPSADIVWLIVGASLRGFVRDLLWMSYYARWRLPVYCYIHNASWRRFRQHRLWLSPVGGTCICVVLTETIARELRSAGFQAEVLPNTLADVEVSTADSCGIPRLVWLGTVSIAKGFNTAYEAFCLLRTTDPSWLFDVYGAGECVDRRANYPGARFNGVVRGEAKRRALERGGVFILPSQYENETQPLSVIEALAFGLPVVASDIGGIKEMLSSGSSAGGICLPVLAGAGAYVAAARICLSQYVEYRDGARAVFDAKFSRARFTARLARVLSKQVQSSRIAGSKLRADG